MFKFGFTLACLVWFAPFVFAQPGSLDTSFGNNGEATILPQPTLNKAYGIALQTDHKIVVAGYALSGSANVFVLARLLPDGSPDVGFGTDGVIETPIGMEALCYAMALQADGKILLAGGAATASNGSKDFALLRFLPNGLLDSTFSADGIQTISIGTGDDIARAVLVQPDGNILVSGTSTNGNNSFMAIARFKPDGMPDVSFSSDGKNTLGIGTIFTNGYAMALQADGKIWLTGAAKFGMADDVALARFLPNGSVDLTFGTAGYIVTNLGSDADSGNSIALQSDGKVLVAGITGMTRDFALLRYLPDGSLDPDFGTQGVVITDFAGSDDYANGLALQTDGKILVGGYAYKNSLPDFALARHLPDGTPDPGFGTGGLVTTDFAGGYDFAFPLAMQADGKMLQAGYSFSNGHTAFALARYISGLNVGLLDFSAPAYRFIAPNPVSQSAVFAFEAETSGSYTLNLFDGQGGKVQTFFSDKAFTTGKQSEFLLFSNNLPAGWYCLQLSTAGHLWAIKMLKN